MKRVLVAGATGYLGRFVCRELKSRGFFVRALARSAAKLDGLWEVSDEIINGEVIQPETLEQVCDGIDVVFSSIGITRQKDGLTFRDVDYQGNKNLLDVAVRAGVRKFVYVSAFNGKNLRHLDIVAAHEDFVDELKASGICYTVLRPTGYFSDIGEVLKMARKGRVWLIGSGEHRVNPIHGADLAVTCADAVDGYELEIDVGGPQTLTWNDAATLAFEVLNKPARVSHVPALLMWAVVRLVRFFNHHQGELLAFFTTMATTDVVAPATGTHTLEAHFRDLCGSQDDHPTNDEWQPSRRPRPAKSRRSNPKGVCGQC
jgi:uncharacterized protein YbjT (DUF2867 family)